MLICRFINVIGITHLLRLSLLKLKIKSKATESEVKRSLTEIPKNIRSWSVRYWHEFQYPKGEESTKQRRIIFVIFFIPKLHVLVRFDSSLNSNRWEIRYRDPAVT